MDNIFWWLIIGAIAGGIASLIVPGRTPGGAIGAVVVGIIGGVIGGWLLDAIFDVGSYSFLGSIVVAIVAAVAILYVMRETRTGSRV